MIQIKNLWNSFTLTTSSWFICLFKLKHLPRDWNSIMFEAVAEYIGSPTGNAWSFVVSSPGFRLRWLLEGWAWTLFTFCNPKIGHLLLVYPSKKKVSRHITATNHCNEMSPSPRSSQLPILMNYIEEQARTTMSFFVWDPLQSNGEKMSCW